MLKPRILAIAIFALAACAAQAQTAAGTSSPAKKELVAKILQLQQPGIEALATGLAQQPASQVMQGAGVALRTRVPADKREALGAAIQADVKKYVDEAVPLARDRAVKLAPSTIGPLLEEKMTEDELKQVIAILESQAFAKYNRLQPELQNALTAKLVSDTRPLIEPKIRALDASVSKRLGIEPAPAGAPAAAASGARRAASN
ncbi:MAG: hypothetical protein V4757_03750 [Pseudomonadota bacterium]